MLKKLARLFTLILIPLYVRPAPNDTPSDEDLEDIEALRDTLGDALRPDGSIDFALLDEVTEPVTLDDLASEESVARTRPSLATPNHS